MGRLHSRSAATPWAIALLVLLLVALLSPLIAPYDPLFQDIGNRFAPPGSRGHILGSDNLGRDIFSRLIYGTRSAFAIGMISTLAGAICGVSIGIVAALNRRLLDSLILGAMDSMLGFPPVLLALIIIIAFGAGVVQIGVAIGLFFIPLFTRLARNDCIVLIQQEHVLAARSIGVGMPRLITRYLLPNMAELLIAECALAFSITILTAAALSFLGLGVQPPMPDWGLMLREARDYLLIAPWMAICPGAAIFVVVLCSNRLADGLSGG